MPIINYYRKWRLKSQQVIAMGYVICNLHGNPQLNRQVFIVSLIIPRYFWNYFKQST